MEHFRITLEDLNSGSVPTISNIPNDLVLDLFKVVKSEKELKIEDLFNWLHVLMIYVYDFRKFGVELLEQRNHW